MTNLKLNKIRQVISYFCQYLLIVLFLIAGVGKISDPVASLEFIEALLGVDSFFAEIILTITICLEFFLALNLFLFGTSKWPYYSISIVLLFFTGIIGYGLWLDLEVLCGCFGSFIGESMINSETLLRNLLLIGISILAPDLRG